MVNVSNMTSPNGNKVANQFIIRGDDFTIFQSYDATIVKKTQGRTYLDKYYWDYSTTTGKYRNLFLGENKKETERKIKLGIYELVDLN